VSGVNGNRLPQDLGDIATHVADLVAARLRPSPWLDKTAIAEHFACSTRSIEQAMAEGMPHSRIFGRAKFQIAECEPWLVEHGYLVLRGDRGMLDGTNKCPGSAQTPRGRTPGGTPDAS
jgi:hypothetical protein